MHIAFLTPEYPHPKVKHAAGIGTSIKNLAVALVNAGITVTVFIYQQDCDEIATEDGVELHLIKHKRYKWFTWYFYRQYVNQYVNGIVEQNGIQILEAPDWTGITAFMRFKIPLIIRLHGSDAYFCKLEGRKQKKKNYLFEKLALKQAQGYIAPTTYAGKVSADIFNLSLSKIKTIHYGLQLSHFINEDPLNFNQNTMLYIGTVIRKKGVFELAKMFNEVIEHQPKAKLIVIGSDSGDIKTGKHSTLELMEEMFSEKARANFSYLGRLPYNQVKNHIKRAHVCVFPSFAETLGMVTIESMAMTKPVVNTSIGWATELIDDGKNGFLVHPSDISLFKERILMLFSNVELCEAIGKEARKKVENTFDIEVIAEDNIKYYKSFISS
ncbi:glycosyltransferase family 4 protein [Aestuariibaculum sediminum]|uniref:Glycosyltransferase family 4 protein n=1 Tax=Aestuariibaculum sediminum TaxID=2770637 RepID=A0A8J6U9F4_9FLAO|nr:glycosyltransferase family 4 protein [Aestuariibaculum sediminum]MBD0833102.1 glycosyltransferase family 4 protein [Aestuariibaculum sediminum]